MRYFHIMTGLRGCYMPDNAYVIACNTRRELKDVLASECDNQITEGYQGGSKRAIASIAALAWRRKDYGLPHVIPYGPKPERIGERANYPYGVFVSLATRREWKEYQASTEGNQ